MNVMCIDGANAGEKCISDYGCDAKIEPSEEIYEGKVYHVTGERFFEEGLFYTLEGKPSWTWYHSRRFAPLSNISEKEIISKREKIFQSQ